MRDTLITFDILKKALLGCVLIAVLVIPVTSFGAAQTTSDAYVTIGTVSVTPENPEIGEETTITAEFRNAETATGSIDVTEVSVRGPGIFSEADDIGILGPGTTVDIPFSVSFEDDGLQKLTVFLRGWDANRNLIVIQKPVYVDVGSDVGASLAFTTDIHDDIAAGETTPIDVTVANGRSETITGIQLTVETTGSVENARRIKGSLESGAESEFQYDVGFSDTGDHHIDATLSYKTENGATRTTTQSIDVQVVDPVVRVDLAANDADTQAGLTTVTLSNFGNTELSDVEITAVKNRVVVERKLVRDIEPNTSAAVQFETGSSQSGAINYTATYTAAGEIHETRHTDQSPIAGEIRLTSVGTTQSGTGVVIDGEAANIGGTDAESVLLEVVDTGDTMPITPDGEYFVGEVEASEFATFELSAMVGSGVTEIPVEISYIVDGERVSTTQSVRITDSVGFSGDSSTQRSTGGGQGGLPVTGIGIGIVVVVIVSGFLIYQWRKP